MVRCLILGSKEELETRVRVRDKYEEMMRKYEGFETCGYPLSIHYNGLMENICDDGYAPCCGLVLLYARLGLHRYNFLQGKDLQLSSVKKYNRSTGGCAAASYYITLEAEDPALGGSLQTFQAKVTELKYAKFLLNCSIARPLGETKKDHIKKCSTFGETFGGKLLSDLMPELPPENPFKNTKRFYVLKKSELQDNDWIRLYLELAVATTNRSSKNEAPTNLKILKVSIETTQDLETPNHGFSAYDATFYIRYKDPCEARVGKDVDRIAIVRRILDKNTNHLRLVGRNESSETIIPKKARKNPCEARVGKDVDHIAVIRRILDESTDHLSLVGRNESSVTIIPKKAKKNRFRSLLSVHKPWRLSTLGGRKSYKNRGVGSTCRLHKTSS